jgi:hypothetical protein
MTPGVKPVSAALPPRLIPYGDDEAGSFGSPLLDLRADW